MHIKKIFFLSLAFLFSFKSLPASPLIEEKEYPVVILGGGVAALTAAVQVSQAGFQPLIITGPSPGGIIVQSHSIRNWPGEIEISGTDLADKLQKQAKACGTLFLPGQVVDIDVSKQPFILTVQSSIDKNKIQKIKARTCIVALGALPKLLEVPGEKENLFTNIFTCAPCDGLRYKGKTVAVIGGGDSALTEAHYLSNLAQKVYLIIRKDQFKTIQPKYRDSVLARSNIEVLYNTSVEAFQKNEQGLSLTLATPKGSDQLLVQGAFLAIGSLPNTGIFKGKLELDKDGYIVLKDQQETSVPQIFAAGDVSDKTFKQAMTAAGDATKAALQAQKYFGTNRSTVQAEPEKLPMKELTSLENLRSVVASSEKPVVVYFYSKYCSPCRSFSFTYDLWASQFQDKALFVKVCGETAPDCFNAFHVEVVPTVLVLDPKGKLLFQGKGSKELAQLPSVLEKQPRL
jgi:thioredoxin reductase (NADPH)